MKRIIDFRGTDLWDSNPFKKDPCVYLKVQSWLESLSISELISLAEDMKDRLPLAEDLFWAKLDTGDNSDYDFEVVINYHIYRRALHKEFIRRKSACLRIDISMRADRYVARVNIETYANKYCVGILKRDLSYDLDTLNNEVWELASRVSSEHGGLSILVG